jgi:hypothetical protein
MIIITIINIVLIKQRSSVSFVLVLLVLAIAKEKFFTFLKKIIQHLFPFVFLRSYDNNYYFTKAYSVYKKLLRARRLLISTTSYKSKVEPQDTAYCTIATLKQVNGYQPFPPESLRAA